jgi:hypothetical protein
LVATKKGKSLEIELMSDDEDGNDHIDFEGILASEKEDADRPFEFMIPANLPGAPELLTTRINATTAEQMLHETLAVLMRKQPEPVVDVEGIDRTAQWLNVREKMVADPELEDALHVASGLFTEHLRVFSHYAVEIALGYSLGMALLPVLERSGGGGFRAEFVEGLLDTSFKGLVTHVLQLRAEVERCLDERAGASVVEELSVENREGD